MGAQAGAFLLSWAGRLGAALGGILGGVAGAIAGKLSANGMRHGAFNQVRAEYNRMVEAAQENIKARIERSREEIRELQAVFQREYDSGRADIIAAADRFLASVWGKIRRTMTEFADNFSRRLDELFDELKREEAEVLAQVPGSWFALIYPRERDLFRSLARSWFRRARRLGRREKEAYLRIPEEHLGARFEAIRTFLNNYDFELATLQEDLDWLMGAMGAARERAGRIRQEAVDQAEALRTRLITKFGSKVADVHAQLIELVQGWNQRIAECRERLWQEGRPVGIEI